MLWIRYVGAIYPPFVVESDNLLGFTLESCRSRLARQMTDWKAKVSERIRVNHHPSGTYTLTEDGQDVTHTPFFVNLDAAQFFPALCKRLAVYSAQGIVVDYEDFSDG